MSLVLMLRYHLTLVRLGQILRGVDTGLRLDPQGFAYKHLGRAEPGYTSHKTTQVQGLQEERH